MPTFFGDAKKVGRRAAMERKGRAGKNFRNSVKDIAGSFKHPLQTAYQKGSLKTE